MSLNYLFLAPLINKRIAMVNGIIATRNSIQTTIQKFNFVKKIKNNSACNRMTRIARKKVTIAIRLLNGISEAFNLKTCGITINVVAKADTKLIPNQKISKIKRVIQNVIFPCSEIYSLLNNSKERYQIATELQKMMMNQNIYGFSLVKSMLILVFIKLQFI